jgi:pyridoxine/pyridoxamine 5'-phosphate oxidase
LLDDRDDSLAHQSQQFAHLAGQSEAAKKKLLCTRMMRMMEEEEEEEAQMPERWGGAR